MVNAHSTGNNINYTTDHDLTVVSSTGKTYNPTISVASNGIWTISNHETLKSDIENGMLNLPQDYNYNEWLMDAWASIRATSKNFSGFMPR